MNPLPVNEPSYVNPVNDQINLSNAANAEAPSQRVELLDRLENIDRYEAGALLQRPIAKPAILKLPKIPQELIRQGVEAYMELITKGPQAATKFRDFIKDVVKQFGKGGYLHHLLRTIRHMALDQLYKPKPQPPTDGCNHKPPATVNTGGCYGDGGGVHSAPAPGRPGGSGGAGTPNVDSFGNMSDRELKQQVLGGGKGSQLAMLELQKRLHAEQQKMMMLSAAEKSAHDTAKFIIQNFT